jgi:cytidine kinase
MTLTVVGSIAFDAVETPSGSRDRLLGGSAVHFSIAASQFAPTRIVGPVGDDFGEEQYAILHRRGVLTDDVEHVPGGRTFFWAGRYHRDINQRDTLQTNLVWFDDSQPGLSASPPPPDVLFLGNIQPDLQREVREQCTAAKFVAMDSMNLWIDIAHASVVETIGMVDCLMLNDSELEQLTDEPNLIRAARKALELGPRVVIAKQGEYGSAMITRDGYFGLTAYPATEIVEPTGAGDTFAGGLMGYVAEHGGDADDATLRRAMAYGTACASFNVEGFGSERLYELDRAAIDARVAELEQMTRF